MHHRLDVCIDADLLVAIVELCSLAIDVDLPLALDPDQLSDQGIDLFPPFIPKG